MKKMKILVLRSYKSNNFKTIKGYNDFKNLTLDKFISVFIMVYYPNIFKNRIEM